MIDTGGTGKGFVDWAFVRENHVEICPLDRRIPLHGFNGKMNTGGYITHVAKVTFCI
jgi:hypothetical protein